MYAAKISPASGQKASVADAGVTAATPVSIDRNSDKKVASGKPPQNEVKSQVPKEEAYQHQVAQKVPLLSTQQTGQNKGASSGNKMPHDGQPVIKPITTEAKDRYKDRSAVDLAAERAIRELKRIQTPGPVPWTPPMDILEAETFLELQLEIPGVHKDSVKVECVNGLLTVSGQRGLDGLRSQHREPFLHSERIYGKFSRSITIPSTYRTEQMRANFHNGVLSIRLGKFEQAHAQDVKQRITINNLEWTEW